MGKPYQFSIVYQEFFQNFFNWGDFSQSWEDNLIHNASRNGVEPFRTIFTVDIYEKILPKATQAKIVNDVHCAVTAADRICCRPCIHRDAVARRVPHWFRPP